MNEEMNTAPEAEVEDTPVAEEATPEATPEAEEVATEPVVADEADTTPAPEAGREEGNKETV